jgi:hypothetical protein
MGTERFILTRSTLRRPATGQRSRLTATLNAASTGLEVFNLTSSFGEYARVSRTSGNNIQFSYSHFPTPPYEFTADATTSGGCSEGRFCWTSARHLYLTYTRPAGVYERSSYDDGGTWTSETSRFAGGSHGDIACDRQGLILRAAYVGGAISLTRQEAGDSAPGTAFNAKDSAGADLSVQNDSFRIVPSLSGWWWMHIRLTAGTTILLYSTDAGATWTTTSGSVTGIASGTHPGICCGHDGTLYSWAYVAGKGKIMRRAPGDVDWSTPVTMKDSVGADLALADAAFSLALAYEGPKRLILTAKISGESTVSDWWSADDQTFTRFA